MTKPNDNWPLVTHSRREHPLAHLINTAPLTADDIAWAHSSGTCPVCPHPAHSGRCRVMVEVYAGETSCGCPENS